MGPIARYLGPEVPQRDADLAGPAARRRPRAGRRAGRRRRSRRRSWRPVSPSPSSSRPPGPRRRRSAAATSAAAPTVPGSGSQPQSGWEVNDPDRPRHGAAHPRGHPGLLQRSRSDGMRISIADLIVLGGCAAVEQAAAPAGSRSRCRSRRAATDASQDETDVESFAALEPTADGFRNYLGKGNRLPAEYLLVDRANLLTLSAPEMTVLRRRPAGARRERTQGSSLGVLTEHPGLADERLLRQPARPRARRGTRRPPTPRPSRVATPPARSRWTGSPRRPGLRLQLRAARPRRGLRQRRRPREVRARLRGRLGPR